MVPGIRIQSMNDHPRRSDGEYVLYWMTAFRRPTWNFSLDRAVEWATELDKPLVILEALRIGYPWASDRLHTFVLQGMKDHLEWFKDKPVTYYPYVERLAGAGSGLLEALAHKASVVITDDFPCFFLPRMIHAASKKVDVLMEKVDSNGLLPFRAADRAFIRAFDFRRFLQQSLAPHLKQTPKPDALFQTKLKKKTLDPSIATRWPSATLQELADPAAWLSKLEIDHSVPPGRLKGGNTSAVDDMKQFVHDRLARYDEDRNKPNLAGASGLSPYLHFGNISSHHILAEVAATEEWSPETLGTSRKGQREGWWNMSPEAEAYLDELVTWRELGFNMCSQRPDYDQYESLPSWAKETLAKHARDPRPHRYTLDQLDEAKTHDPLWNAAHTQLKRDGRIHNYLRMLWGKKILEWSDSSQEALQAMIHLNNKYALDGRNPNSYSGIFWVLGRYDRPWAPERPIFGTIRYMSSENTARKHNVKSYIERYS